MLCAYFKSGVCEKGKRCKYSHDLNLENKSAKIDIYTDPRDRAGKPEWRTDIICTHFLDAVEKNLYGWLWECPNGADKCVYTHSLPIGYVLQRDKKDMEKALRGDDEDEKTIEEIIEEERALLVSETLTPVTKDTFLDWKKRKAEKKQKDLEDKMKESAQKPGGNKGGILSGRMLFKFDPTLFQDDEAAADEDLYQERNEDEEQEEERKEGEAIIEEAGESDQEDEANDIGKIGDKPQTNGDHAKVDTELFQ